MTTTSDGESADARAVLTRNITFLLEFTGRTQAELATHLGLSQGHISLLLNGKREWQIDVLDRIADYFCVTVPALFVNGNGHHERRSGKDRRVRGERRKAFRP